MKTKSFDDYLKKKLSVDEIAEIEEMARLEYLSLKALQDDISTAVLKYMTEKKIGFNELARRLDVSPSQLSRIKRGEANLTLSSIAHIFALLHRKPHLVFSE